MRRGEVENKLSADLVNLADETISAVEGTRASDALLSQALSKAGIAETLNPLGTGSFPSPAAIFDAFAPGGSPALRQHFEQFFEVVAEPGARLNDTFQLGDFLVRKAMGEGFGHVAIIAAHESWDYEQLSSAGLIPENHRRGTYVRVVEGGARPHALADSFARLILDETVRMPHDQMIIRLRPEIMRWQEGISGLFEDVADTTVAVPDFDPSKRAEITRPILDPKQNTETIRWNQKMHPGQSGVGPNDIRTELGRYVDLSKVKEEIDNRNKANPKNQIEVGTPPIDAVFVEAVHQFQVKSFVETNQIDGRAGESTLDSLGLVNRKGLHEADKPNPTAQERLKSKGKEISKATGGEFTAKNWFRNMVNPAFLGRRFESAGELTGIHLVFARKLRIAERHLLSMPAYVGLTPVELGKVLEIDERHKGMRYKKGSKGNHTFGLALDINYLGNPYVAGDKDRPAGNKSFIEIMKSVTRLISGMEIEFTPAYLHGLATEPDPSTGRMRSTGEIYDALTQRDREFREYLQLAADTEAIKIKLQERLNKGTVNVFVSDKEKGDLEAASRRWQKQIQGHLKSLKTYFGARRNPLNGFLNLNRDLVVALRDQACLAWGAIDLGPNRSGDIMHFDCRMDGVGKILNRGYAPQTGHPCLSAAGHAPEILSEDNPSAPRLLHSETTPPGKTLYVEIDLKIFDKKKNEIAQPCTGIFIPQNYKPQSAVDLILYLHGHKGTFPGNDKSINEYWDDKKFPFFALREGLNDSGKNFILVAPTLGPQSETGILTNPGELDKYLGQVMEALKAYGPYKDLKQDPMAGSIILASHSGGGSPMLKLAKLKGGGGYADKIVQCWGFDSLYANKLDDPDDEKERKQKWLAGEWANWANSHQDARLFFYYYDNRPRATSEKLKKKRFQHNNVCVAPSTAPERKKKEKSKADPHFWVPIAHWLDRLNNVPCNAAKSGKESESLTSIQPRTPTAAEDTLTFPSGESLTVISGADGPGEEYYDPNTSGNPLLDTSGNNKTKKLSMDFTVDEFARSGPKKFDKARIDPELVNCLQAIHDYIGKSVIINSGYRSYSYNLYLYKKLGREPKKKSQHLSGRAADIKIPGMTGVEIAKAAMDSCGCKIAIGLAPNFAHVDVRGKFRVWSYGGASEEQIKEIRLYHREKCGKPSESETVAFEYSVAEGLGSATEDYSLREIADGTLGKLPDDILAAILTKGEGDAKDLTDRVFWQKHPDLTGKTLDPEVPKQQALQKEWGRIWRRQVKPIVWLRQLIDELDRRRGDIPREFLLGWMAAESDGKVFTVSTLGERGYFQIMWQNGEAKSQLGLTSDEFLRLSTDREFSIEKGAQLAKTYRQHFLRKYSTVPDGSDLLWRLTKGRHALPTALDKVLDRLVKAGTTITWQAVSQRLPKMSSRVDFTLDYVAKLKPLADLFPAPSSATPEFYLQSEPSFPQRKNLSFESGILHEQPGSPKCGFHGPNGAFVIEADLRAAVATVARDERNIWWVGNTAQKEDNNVRFGDLVRYWLAGHTGTIRPGKLESVQKAALDPSVTYSNRGNATLEKDVQKFRKAAGEVDNRAADVYKKSDGVDSADAKVKDAGKKAKDAETAAELASKKVKTAGEGVKAASGQSGSGAQAALDAAKAALSVATTELNAAEKTRDDARKARDDAKNALDMAKKALEAAKQSHEQAKKDRDKLKGPAQNWKDSDKQDIRKAILKKAGSTDPQKIDTLVEEALQLAHQSRADIEAWSAVFVVSCVRAAAINHKLEAIDSSDAHQGLDGLLKASRRHSDYVVKARERKSKAVGGTYHTFEPTDRAVQVGDIICTDRTDFIEKRVLLKDVKKGDLLHADIVTLVKTEKGKPVYAETIGGNVGHTVRRRRYPLNDTGRLIVSATGLFVKEDDNGVFGSLTPLTHAPKMLPVESAGRIFALLSLVCDA